MEPPSQDAPLRLEKKFHQTSKLQMAIPRAKQLKTGFTAYVKAIRLIRANKLTKYLFIPAILNIIVVVAFIFSGVGTSERRIFTYYVVLNIA